MQPASPPPLRYKNVFDHPEEQREKIILYSEKAFKRFPVFLDQEIGIPENYRNKIQENVSIPPFRTRRKTARAQRRSWRWE